MFHQQTSPSGRALHIVRWRGRNQYETNNTLVQYILGTYVSFGVSVAEVEPQFLHLVTFLDQQFVISNNRQKIYLKTTVGVIL